jgi:hypothetical protein
MEPNGVLYRHYLLGSRLMVTGRTREPDDAAKASIRRSMNIFIYPQHFFPEILTRPEGSVRASDNLVRDPPCVADMILIGVRSPSDQLQVVAIKACYPH